MCSDRYDSARANSPAERRFAPLPGPSCGGGGGYLQSGYTDERRAYGDRKLRQILETGADYCIAPCHNCHSGLKDIIEAYDVGMELSFFSEIIYECMEKPNALEG